jgi:transcriptional regulator with XRE-family HTH domain
MLDMTGYPSKGDNAEMPQAMLARKLRVLRAERGLSLRKHMPWDHTLAKLAKGYGVPVSELIGDPSVPLAI